MPLSYAQNSTYTNPILPGWHSDPSCTFVTEEDNLMNWKLASHVVTRVSQVPEIANSTLQTQQDGLWASTIRYRKGKFYLLTSYVSMYPDFGFKGLLFTTEDIYSDESWSEPLRFEIGDIDPDIFWDEDGAGLPEGPLIYKKDNWYYLCIGEEGTELGHRQAIARSQNVGHADLFQDGNGNWWGVALATRSGPAWKVYPMGRETVVFHVTWREEEWPVLEPVRGRMTGWELPQPSTQMPGDGPYVDAPDRFNFAPGTPIPRHFLFWRFPKSDALTVSPPERPYSLRLLPSQHNITGLDVNGDRVAQTAITLIPRRQSHTYFTYSVDVSSNPTEKGEEVGVTVFLTQYQHIDLGIVLLSLSGELVLTCAFQTILLDDLNTSATQNVTPPETVVKALPPSKNIRVRLRIEAVNDTHCILSAVMPGRDPFDFSQQAEALIVSGGIRRFTGVLLGVYATSNGGLGSTPSYISRWRYEGLGQKVGE
ncbi:glycosyl hydrolase [Aspergillus desertorum]